MSARLIWRIPAWQRLLFEEFDDGTVMFDAGVGSTHLLNDTAAAALSIMATDPVGLTSDTIRSRLVEVLAIEEQALPASAVLEMLFQLENLGLVAVGTR